jgi:bacterioferritin
MHSACEICGQARIASAMDRAREIITRLKKSYAMELESVQNYLANSIDLEGPPADEVKKVLEAAITSELKHARRLAKRIKILDGRVPGSLELPRNQNFFQPPMDNRDFVTVIRGALTATDAAIAHYQATMQITEGLDYITQDLLIELLADEQEQRGSFHQLLVRLA